MAKTWKVMSGAVVCLAVAVSSAVSDDLEDGRRAFEEGNYLAAFRLLEPLAHAENPEAQFLVGQLFLNGYTLPEDPIEAARLFRRAAKKGHAEAQFALSNLLSIGRGVKKDEELAAQWSVKAARQGLAKAQLQMGYRYDLGDGVPTDHEEAAYWYVTAAENGAVDPNVGLAYCSGSGIELDLVEGHFWLSVYLVSQPMDKSIQEARSFCAEEMTPDEVERAEDRFAAWRQQQVDKRVGRAAH